MDIIMDIQRFIIVIMDIRRFIAVSYYGHTEVYSS